MKFLKNRLFIGALCIVIAVLIGFFAVPVMVSITNKKVEVVAASANIPKGSEITASQIQVVQMFSSDVPPGSGLLISDVVGKYTTTDITQNDIIFKSKLTSSFPYADEALYTIPVGKYAVAVSVSSLSSSIAGKVKPGDVVTVLVNLSGSDNTASQAVAYSELMYMKVLGVTNVDAIDISTEQEEQLLIPATVTLLCNLEQAKLLAGFEGNSQIHLALVARENSILAPQYLLRQDEYFQQIEDARQAMQEEAARIEEERIMMEEEERLRQEEEALQEQQDGEEASLAA